MLIIHNTELTDYTTELKVKCLPHCKYPPSSGHKTDAGLDIHYNGEETVHLDKDESTTLPSGISVAIPRGWVGIVQNRSSYLVAGEFTVDGTVDSGYRGEVKIVVHARKPTKLEPGQKLAQIVVVPHTTKYTFVDKLPKGERGDDGFGSTGR